MAMNVARGLYIGEARQAPVFKNPRPYTSDAEAQRVRVHLAAVLRGRR